MCHVSCLQEKGLCFPMVNKPLPDAPELRLDDTNKSHEECCDQDVGASCSSSNQVHAAGPAASQGHMPNGSAGATQKLMGNANSTKSFTADTGVTTSSQQLLLRASLLAQAMDRAGPVRVSSTSVIVPREWLRDALQATVQGLVSEALDDFQVWMKQGGIAWGNEKERQQMSPGTLALLTV